MGCRDGVCAKLGNGLRYPKLPITEREPTFLLCVLLVVCALPLPCDAARVLANPTCQHPSRTPQLCAPLPRLAHPFWLPPASPRRLPCVFTACHPRSPLDRHLPPRSQVELPVAPQNYRPRIKHRPCRIGRHQKRKTPLLYIARIAHRPSPLPIEVWTSSRFRRNAVGYGFAQDLRTLLSSPFVLDILLSIFSLPHSP